MKKHLLKSFIIPKYLKYELLNLQTIWSVIDLNMEQAMSKNKKISRQHIIKLMEELEKIFPEADDPAINILTKEVFATEEQALEDFNSKPSGALWFSKKLISEKIHIYDILQDDLLKVSLN